MPTHNSLGADDGCGVENARTVTIKPNEQGAGGPAQMQSAWCALLQDIEQSHSTQTKRKAIPIMRRSCSDSRPTASQVDGVFGSDTSIENCKTNSSTILSMMMSTMSMVSWRQCWQRYRWCDSSFLSRKSSILSLYNLLQHLLDISQTHFKSLHFQPTR